MKCLSVQIVFILVSLDRVARCGAVPALCGWHGPKRVDEDPNKEIGH
jgi:hypothetical protein